MGWITEFAARAELTDKFKGHPDHLRLLAAGLMGEAGGISAELKKEARERDAYPAYRHKLMEELGDMLWYFVRLATVVDNSLLSEIERIKPAPVRYDRSLPLVLEMGSRLGRLFEASNVEQNTAALRSVLLDVWRIILEMAEITHLDLGKAAAQNSQKIKSRWPQTREYSTLFDSEFPEEEQLPRILEIDFREQKGGSRPIVVLRCNGVNFGDRLSDNIEDADGYRYHDAFHFAYAVHLGWSPVIRSLLRCKRKSNGAKDEGQDGARAAIIEEAVSAIIFSRAKRLNLFDGSNNVDYELLKVAHEFVEGFEVESVPLWQWEAAILSGFNVFRQLRHNSGGTVRLDINRRELRYVAPTR